MDEPVIVISHIRARQGYEAIVQDLLAKMVEPTQAEEGCIAFTLHQSRSDPRLFMLFQVWASEEQLERHGATAHSAGFRRVAPTVLDGPIGRTLWKKVR
ncbi:MAG TPA: putative quinol monooxygenase [Candidatus Sulfotelmatobacter sp.]|nr:putative quinol monooxygenase [Candidatus Sulfotelmatobacter sp.]